MRSDKSVKSPKKSMTRKEIIKHNEISTLYEFTLGGYPQKVLIEGRSRKLPVVITLHGGPGTPVPFSVGSRGLFPQFTDRFIMVYWDQLGCGINNQPLVDDLTIDSFVNMTIDLIKEVKSLFPQNKILLFSTSWGSVLSAKALEKSPHLVDAVLSNGQIIKNVFFCAEVMNALSAANVPQKKLAQLRQANASDFKPSDLQTVSSCLRKYTNAYTNKEGKQASVGKIVFGLLTSPDYSFKDFKAIVVNGYLKNTSLWKEIIQLDLSEALRSVEIPYMILQGDTDIVASTKTVVDLVGNTNNHNLQYKIIPQTGHMPSQPLIEEVYRQLIALST